MNWFKKRKRKKWINRRMQYISSEIDKVTMEMFYQPITYRANTQIKMSLFREWFELEEELKDL